MSRTFLIIFTLILIFSWAHEVIAVDYLPLVPCGLQNQPTGGDPKVDYTKDCTKCGTFRLGKNIIDLVLFGIVPPLAALFFLIGGLLILLGGANPKAIGLGRSIFSDTFWGLVIIFSAWMITNTLIKSFGPNQLKDVAWYKFVCEEVVAVTPRPSPTPTPTVSPTIPPEEELVQVQTSARALINAIGIGSFSTNAGCGDAFHARQNIQDMANAKYPAVCSPSCSPNNLCVAGGPSGKTTVNPKILDGLRSLSSELKNKFGIGLTVTSFTTGKHSANSAHYSGQGVDIVPNSNNPAHWQAARDFLDNIGGGTAICELPSGSNDPGCDLDNVDHIHWTLPR